jgi:formylmethanofuran dehydrogenase subunit E
LYEPELDDVYKEIFKDTESLRMRFKISEEFLENFDKGWAHFIKLFPRFMNDVQINYASFRENKVFFNGKILKLKKALLDYYINNPDKCSREFGWGMKFDPDNAGHMQELEAHVIQNLDLVGRYKLPSKGMELVLSNNFADWFLCASGEKWHSCVSLESNFAGAFWTGIPGTIVDKNRTMLYLTDGTTKYPYGIKTESFISRSWVLLDEMNKLNFVRFFPSQMLSLGVVKRLTGLDFSTDENRRFRTKYPIDFLYFVNNKSAFVYLDYGRFVRSEEGTFIEYSEKGRFSYHDRTKDKIFDGSHIYMYTHGLQYLIEKKISLNDLIIKTCLSCGGLFDEQDLVTLEGQTFCKTCFEKNVYFCEECHIPVAKRSENRYRMVGRQIYCRECFNIKFATCQVCEKHKLKKEVTFVRERELWFCNDCLKQEEITCTRCDTCNEGNIEVEENSFENLYDGTRICKKCLRKEMDKTQLFLDFPPVEQRNNLGYVLDGGNIIFGGQLPAGYQQTLINPTRFDWGDIALTEATTTAPRLEWRVSRPRSLEDEIFHAPPIVPNFADYGHYPPEEGENIPIDDPIDEYYEPEVEENPDNEENNH